MALNEATAQRIVHLLQEIRDDVRKLAEIAGGPRESGDTDHATLIAKLIQTEFGSRNP